jgi:hypothetical protein
MLRKNRPYSAFGLLTIMIALAVLGIVSSARIGYGNSTDFLVASVSPQNAATGWWQTHEAEFAQTLTAIPYDPTLWAQRQQYLLYELSTGGGPREYAVFFTTEQALVFQHLSTVNPPAAGATLTALPYDATLYAARRSTQASFAVPWDTLTSVPFNATETAIVATYQGTPAAPYDPVVYATRQAELRNLATAAGPATYVLFYAQETVLASAYQGTPAPSPAPTSMRGMPAQCAYMWARRPLPAITQYAQIALNLAGVAYTNAYAEAYGEDCIDSQTNQVVGFGAMSTDFYLTIPVDNLADASSLGKLALRAYAALTDGIYLNWLPAPFGYLDITFTLGGEQKILRGMFSQYRGPRDAAALVEALGGLR